MNKNRKIFIVVFIIFTLVIALFAIDMARRTTAPWNRKKQLERAFIVSEPTDSVAIDTITAKE
jgi:regulatory protein YycI of two-component signal transduction system YycFG